MRTTVTLDDDVSAGVRAEARRSGRPVRQVVNDLLRIALMVRRSSADARPFKVRARPLGIRAGLEYDDIGHLVEHVEGPLRR